MIEELMAIFFRALVSLAFGVLSIPLITLSLYLNKEGNYKASMAMMITAIGFIIMVIGVWLI